MNSTCNIFKFYGEEWAEFVKTSMYTNVNILHFMSLEEDTYYVTGYDDDGFECGGYHPATIGSRPKRCFLYMDDNLGRSPVSSHNMYIRILFLYIRLLCLNYTIIVFIISIVYLTTY